MLKKWATQKKKSPPLWPLGFAWPFPPGASSAVPPTKKRRHLGVGCVPTPSFIWLLDAFRGLNHPTILGLIHVNYWVKLGLAIEYLVEHEVLEWKHSHHQNQASKTPLRPTCRSWTRLPLEWRAGSLQSPSRSPPLQPSLLQALQPSLLRAQQESLVESKQRCRYLPEASFDRRCLLACCSCVIAQDAERPGCIRPRGLPCQWHRRPETSTSKRTVRNTVAKMDFLWEETQSREKNKNFFWGFSSGPHIKSQAAI